MRQRSLLTLIVGLVLVGSAWAGSLPPVDEAGEDPAFERFRTQFLQIVRKRDLSAFEKRLHPNVKLSLGNGTGIPSAIRHMREDPSRWEILERVLQSGGRFKTFGTADQQVRMFFAPYTYFARRDDSDSLPGVAVVAGVNVNVRAHPSTNAAVIGQLSHWVVHASFPAGNEDRWIKVRMPSGPVGYVSAKYIAWPTDFRAGFALHEGDWKLRVFLAGD